MSSNRESTVKFRFHLCFVEVRMLHADAGQSDAARVIEQLRTGHELLGK